MKTFGKLEKIKKNLGRESKKDAAAEALGLLGKMVPPGRKEEEKDQRVYFVMPRPGQTLEEAADEQDKKKLTIEVVHVNDRGERIEPTEKERELDRKIEGHED